LRLHTYASQRCTSATLRPHTPTLFPYTTLFRSEVVTHNSIPQGSMFTMEGPLEYRDQFKQARGNRWDSHIWLYASRGTLQCFHEDRKSTRLNSSHLGISYAVFCLKKTIKRRSYD